MNRNNCTWICTWVHVNVFIWNCLDSYGFIHEFMWIINMHSLYEFIWSCMNAKNSRGGASGAYGRCVQKCVAVRTLVCAQWCTRQCAVVFLVVYGSVHGSVRLSGSAAVCGSARSCVWQCARQCVAVRLAVCGSALYILLCTQSFTIYILVCPYRGSGGEPHTPHILIRTNRSIWVINTN